MINGHRIILRAESRTSTKDMHKQLKLNLLVDRRHLHTAHQVYKGLNELTPANIRSQLTLLSEVTARETRASSVLDLVVPNFNLETTRKSFRYRCPFIWNLLDYEQKSKQSFASFKYSLINSDLFET